MDPKDTVQLYINLCKNQMDRFTQTQVVEWKGNFGVWTLLAAAAYLVAKEHVHVPLCLAAVLLLLLNAAHIGWLKFIHDSEQFDKKLWVHFRTEALKAIPGEAVGNELKHNEFVWDLFEGGVTAVLSVALFALIWKINNG